MAKSNKLETYADLQKKLDELKAEEQAIRNQMREEQKRMKEAEKKAAPEAMSYLGALVLKAIGVDWRDIDFVELNRVLRDASVYESAFKEHDRNSDPNTELKQLREFVNKQSKAKHNSASSKKENSDTADESGSTTPEQTSDHTLITHEG